MEAANSLIEVAATAAGLSAAATVVVLAYTNGFAYEGTVERWARRIAAFAAFVAILALVALAWVLT